jgi:hypothetical protein
MAFPDIKLGSSFDAKGFKQAETASAKLEKGVKKLAGAFGLAFSTRAVVNFSKAAVKAFAEDDAAITVLRQNLKNLGLAYQSVNAENFIGKLEQQTGILDDELRPAYSKLSKITLSTTKTQELMALAVDLARSNGLEFSAVINTLSRAYVGNYKGLKQLNIGLTDAELATKDFAEIQAILIKQSQGAGKAYIETFAGSIDKLSVASANAKEVIGEGLVDLFADMAGNGDIDAATANVNKFATAVSDLLKDVSEYNLADFVSAFVTGNITEGTASKLVKRPSARRFFTGGSGVDSDLLAARAAAAKIKADKLAAANKIKADKLAAANKAKLDKAAAVFDLQKIQIAAALKGKISEEEKTRLLLMQAIEEGNADKAEALAKKLEEIQAKNAKIAADLLAIGEAKDPFSTWAGSLSLAIAALAKLGLGMSAITSSMIPGVTYNPSQNPDRNYDDKVAAAEKAAADKAAADKAAADKIAADAAAVLAAAGDKAAADAAAAAAAAALAILGIPGTTFNPGQNPDRNYDDKAAAETAAAAALAASATNTSQSPINPNGTFGFSLPSYLQNSMPQSSSINIVIEGNVLDGDDFTNKVNDALLNANRQGLPRTAAGTLVNQD